MRARSMIVCIVVVTGSLSAVSTASAAFFKFAKDISFSNFNGTTTYTGFVTLGRNSANDFSTAAIDTKGPTSFPVFANPNINGLNLTTLTASDGGAFSTSIGAVGRVSSFNGNPVGAHLEVMLKTPSGFPGGFSAAKAKVMLNGDRTIVSIKNNGFRFINPLEIEHGLKTARAEGAILDPIHLRLENLSTGEVIDSDIYRNLFSGRNGGEVGLSDMGLLDLGIPDNPSQNAFAAFTSETLVPYATDLTGSARLEHGVLTVTGLFDPGANPITDLWDLTFSATDSGFITRARFKNTAAAFSELAIDPTFLDPFTSDDDLVHIEVESDIGAALLSIPEPATLTAMLLGLGGLTVRRRRGGSDDGGR